MESRRPISEERVVRRGQTRNEYGILMEKFLGKRPIIRLRRRRIKRY
jgi:hypothetical protein